MPVNIIDTLGPKNDGDFATHSSEFSKGGFKEVADITARDAITTERRVEGMHVYVISSGEIYTLGAGLTNGDWSLASIGSAPISTFVYQPGGTASGNVYTDFTALVSAYNTQAQPGLIRLDDTFSPGFISIPAGSHDFNRPAIIFCPLIRGSFLQFEVGATITGVAEIRGCIINIVNTGPVLTFPSSQGMNLVDSFVQSPGGGAMFKLTSSFARVRFINTDFDSGTPLVDVDSGATFVFSLIESSLIANDTVTGAGNIIAEVGPDSRFNRDQSSHTGGSTVTYLDPDQSALITKTSGSGALAERGSYVYNLASPSTQVLPETAFSAGPLTIINNGPEILTIDGDSSETINGGTTIDIPANFTAVLRSDQSGAWIATVSPNSETYPDEQVEIQNDYLALNAPSGSLLSSALSYIDSNYKPFWPTASTTTTLYVRTTGNDSTGDGTIGLPFLTIQRALQFIPVLNGPAAIRTTIDIGPGVFTFPRILEANYTTFQGTTTVEDTLTIDSDTAVIANNTAGIVISVTSTGGPYAADELRGRQIVWTSGTSSGNTGWIYRNDVTSSGITLIYATHDSGTTAGIESMAVGNTIDLISLDTTIEYPGGSAVIQNSVQCNFTELNVSATSSSTNLFCLTTDKIDYSKVYFDGSDTFDKLQVGGFGRAFLTNCYYAGAGPFGSEAFLSAKNNGFLQINRGTVLDADLNNSNANRRYVEGEAGSLMAFAGHVVCRGFDNDRIFEMDGIGVFPVGGIDAFDTILIEDENGTNTYQVGPVFKVNSTGAGQGGWYQFPNTHGSITADYTVEAENCACVAMGSSSTITDATGTNSVSADGGTSNSAASPDTTFITGGTPGSDGFARRHLASFVDGDLAASILTVNHNLGNRYVTIAIYDDSEDLITPGTISTINSNSLSVDLSSFTPISGTWNLIVIG